MRTQAGDCLRYFGCQAWDTYYCSFTICRCFLFENLSVQQAWVKPLSGPKAFHVHNILFATVLVSIAYNLFSTFSW